MADKKEEFQTVRPVDDVEFEWNDKSGFHKAGKKTMIHMIQAEKMTEKGFGKKVLGGKKEVSKTLEKADV